MEKVTPMHKARKFKNSNEHRNASILDFNLR